MRVSLASCRAEEAFAGLGSPEMLKALVRAGLEEEEAVPCRECKEENGLEAEEERGDCERFFL